MSDFFGRISHYFVKSVLCIFLVFVCLFSFNANAAQITTNDINSIEAKFQYAQANVTAVKNHVVELAESIGQDFKNHPLRMEYEHKVNELAHTAQLLKTKIGQSPDALKYIAQHLWQERRHLGEQYKNVTPKPLRDYIYELNTIRYGDILGPSFEYLMDKYKGNYHQIIEASTRPNADINKLLSGFKEWLITKEDKYLK